METQHDIQPKDMEKYNEFVTWMGTPPELREHKTEEMLANHLDCNRSTLWTWKQKKGFWDEVKQVRLQFGKSRTPEILEAWFKKIKKNPSSQDIQLWLEYFDDHIHKEGLEIDDKSESAKKLESIMHNLIKRNKEEK